MWRTRLTTFSLKGVRAAGGLFGWDGGEDSFEFFESLGSVNFVEAGVVVQDSAIGANDDPEGELSALFAWVTEGFEERAVVVSDGVSEVHEFGDFACGAASAVEIFGGLEVGVGADSDDLQVLLLSAAVIEEFEVAGLAIGFCEGGIAVIPEVQNDGLAFEGLGSKGISGNEIEGELGCRRVHECLGAGRGIFEALLLLLGVGLNLSGEFFEWSAGSEFGELGECIEGIADLPG